ncbi:MAG: hypothetical protein WA359_08695 [Acidimicrobiales bacterium]
MRPFTLSAYVLIALPALVALALYARVGGFRPARIDVTAYYRTHSSHRVAAWVVILILALALESVGLALGGRSTSVPTLSTTLDHLLVEHWGRWLLFLAWLGVGARPIARLRQPPRGDQP